MRKKVWVLGLLMLLLTACKADEETQTEVRDVNEQLLNEWAGNIEIPQSPLPIILKLEKESGEFIRTGARIARFSVQKCRI